MFGLKFVYQENYIIRMKMGGCWPPVFMGRGKNEL